MPEDLLALEAEPIEDLEVPLDGETPEPEGEQPGGEPETPKTPITSLFQPDGKRFDPQISSALAKIKAENPEMGKILMRSLSRVGELDREFPGGLTEVRELREKVENLGGFEGIEQKLQGAAEMDGLAKQYMDADPAFIDDLIESSPEAFAALAPVVFAKYAETNADGFSAYIGRIVYGNMQEQGIPLMLMRLGDLISDKPAAMEALNKINGYLGGFKEMASRQAETPRPRATAPKSDDLTKREESLRSREWQSDRTATQREIVNSEYSKALAGRKPTGEEKAQINELFLSRSTAQANRLFPGWEEKAARFIKSNDKAGYLRYMQTIYRRVVPDAVSSAVSSTLRGKKAAVPGAQPVRKEAGPAPVAGFAPVAQEPGSFEIDYGRTTRAMLMENRAVLKDGKKVAWKG